PNVHNLSAYSSGGGGQRAGKHGACIRALAAFKISVRSRNAIFSCWDFILVHPQTRRTTWFAKHKACFFKYFINAFFFCLCFHLFRARNNPHLYVICFFLALYKRSNSS